MAPQQTIGQLVDDDMSAIERDNTTLKGDQPKDCADPGLDKLRLGQLINLVGDIALGTPADRAKDTLVSLAVRKRRGQEGQPVLHARPCRALVAVLCVYWRARNYTRLSVFHSATLARPFASR